MGFTVVYFAGHVLRHIGGILMLCWRRMVRAALITGSVAFIFAEIGGSSLTHQIPAPIPAHIVAVLFALGLAYGAALTTLLAEIILGASETIRLLEGEADAGARAAAVIGERAEGELSGFVGRMDAAAIAFIAILRGRRASTQPQRASTTQAAKPQERSHTPPPGAMPSIPRKGPPAPIAQRPPLELQHVAPAGGKPSQMQDAAQGEIITLNLETLADIAATEEFIQTAPRPAVHARPVSADHLPRIEWAYDKSEQQHDNGDSSEPAPLVAPLESQAESQATPATPAPLLVTREELQS